MPQEHTFKDSPALVFYHYFHIVVLLYYWNVEQLTNSTVCNNSVTILCNNWQTAQCVTIGRECGRPIWRASHVASQLEILTSSSSPPSMANYNLYDYYSSYHHQHCSTLICAITTRDIIISAISKNHGNKVALGWTVITGRGDRLNVDKYLWTSVNISQHCNGEHQSTLVNSALVNTGRMPTPGQMVFAPVEAWSLVRW